MYLRTFIAFQMGQCVVNLALHLILCAKLFRRDPNKSLCIAILCLLATPIVLRYYYYPIYHDYQKIVYELAIPFAPTGVKYADQVNASALLCVPFILMAFGLLYFLLRRKSGPKTFYNFTESKILCRAVYLNTILAALIDLLVTRVFMGDDPVITIFHLAYRVLGGALFFHLVYLPIVLCMTLRAPEVEDDEGGTAPRAESLFRTD